MQTITRTFVAAVIAWSAIARADAVSDENSKRLYEKGKAAFSQRDFRRAYDAFKEAYVLSSEPAFLFNIASTQQELGRSAEAADTLRAYVRVKPADPDRPLIEERIRALEEKQRLIQPQASPAPAPAPIATVARAPESRAEARTPVYKKAWLWTVVGVAVVGVGLGVGLGLGLNAQPSNRYPLVRF